MATNLVTKAEYKAYLGISSVNSDTEIDFLIPKVSDFVKTYCRRTFIDYYDESKTEFFDGELSGSTIIVETGSLNGNNVFLEINTTLVEYTASITSSNTTNFTAFINSSVGNGKIFLYYDSSSLLSINSSISSRYNCKSS